MELNLKARLKRIRDIQARPENDLKPERILMTDHKSWLGWEEAGFNIYKRTVRLELPATVPRAFSKSLAIIVPDLARLGSIPLPRELLFFDLETTGLSSGAGTIAFLAAFGRFASAENNDVLEITQYLLLDYPGEAGFVELMVGEFEGSPIVVSYNGKCFDAQILKTRCLMNGIKAPLLLHADLLHPARRLWKLKLPNCSQATIESSVLGISREGDVSGALAPEIWFSFLRSGDNRELLLVCEHNIKDIMGLAQLFLVLGEISIDPVKSRDKFNYDEERLALFWKKTLRKNRCFFKKSEYEPLAKTGALLLKNAAKNGGQKAACALLKGLAINAEWQLKDPALALKYTDSALALPEILSGVKNDLELRRARLERKISRTDPITAN